MHYKNLKHKKIKNTGLLYEFLIRQTTSDVLSGNDPYSLKLIKKYFTSNSPLGQELALYETLMKQKVKDSNFALRIVETVVQSRQGIDRKALAQDKYNLLKEISKKYDVDSFFKTKINDYPVYASIYTLLEYTEQDNIQEYIEHKVNVTNHLLTETKSKSSTGLPNTLLQDVDPELKSLTIKIMAERFNDKWSALNENQKTVLRQFIKNPTTSKESYDFLKQHALLISNQLSVHAQTTQDPVLKIKLQEALNVLPKVENPTFITETHYLTLIRYYELLQELKNSDAQ